MKKVIILLIMLFLMVGIVYGQDIDNCKGTITPEEVPCWILLANSTGLDCNNINVSVYKNGSFFVYSTTMDDYSPFKCNATFNQTEAATYTFQYTTLDTGSIVVQESETMSIAIAMVTSGFGGLILLLGIFLFVYSSFKNKDTEKENTEFGVASKPRLAILDLVAGGTILLGFLLFLVGLHLMTIRSTGDTATILNYTFISFLWIYIALIIFAVLTIIIQLLRWLAWSASTPEWKKNKR